MARYSSSPLVKAFAAIFLTAQVASVSAFTPNRSVTVARTRLSAARVIGIGGPQLGGIEVVGVDKSKSSNVGIRRRVDVFKKPVAKTPPSFGAVKAASKPKVVAKKPVVKVLPKVVAKKPIAKVLPKVVAKKPIVKVLPKVVAKKPVVKVLPKVVAKKPVVKVLPKVVAKKPVVKVLPKTAVKVAKFSAKKPEVKSPSKPTFSFLKFKDTASKPKVVAKKPDSKLKPKETGKVIKESKSPFSFLKK